MNSMNLYNNNLTELTESDLISICQLNNIKPNELNILDLRYNKLTNLNFIQENTPFINLKELKISGNKNIKNISNIKYLPNLELLNISGLNLKDEKETVKILKNMKYLKIFICDNTFKLYNKEQLKKELPNIKQIYLI